MGNEVGCREREMMLNDYKRALYWILFRHYLSLIARLSSLMANQAEVLPNIVAKRDDVIGAFVSMAN